MHIINFFQKCLTMHNFATLTSILSAFGTAPIHRLNRTWSQVNARTTAILEKLRTLMNSSRNFAPYREALHQANPPCIPFFGNNLVSCSSPATNFCQVFILPTWFSSKMGYLQWSTTQSSSTSQNGQRRQRLSARFKPTRTFRIHSSPFPKCKTISSA